MSSHEEEDQQESARPESGEHAAPAQPLEEGELDRDESQDGESDDEANPPLPDEAVPSLPDEAPPLPNEAPPATKRDDDGWEACWDENARAFFFFNRHSNVSQWTNPRVPEVVNAEPPAPGTEPRAGDGHDADPPSTAQETPDPDLVYNPAIHGDYDPTAPYAAKYTSPDVLPDSTLNANDSTAEYVATGTFNRFTGKWQADHLNPDNHNDENKSRRQMNAFFDVDTAANSHDGRSLKAERAGKKLTKQELKAFKVKRKERKEEKRRAWLRD